MKELFLLWRHVDRTGLAKLRGSEDAAARRSTWKQLLKPSFGHALVDEIYVDLATNVFEFCARSQFSDEVTSTLVSIALDTLRFAHSQPVPGMKGTFDYFQQSLVRHSVQRPPFSISVFSLAQVKLITQYMVENFFRHLKMYQFAFVVNKRLDLHVYRSVAEAVPVETIHDLDDAVHELDHAVEKARLEAEAKAEQERREKEEEAKRQAEAERAERERKEKLRAEQGDKAVIAAELERVQAEFEAKIKAQNDAFEAKLAAMEAKLAKKKSTSK
eukprot:TRINITY_DN6681_c0_g1_i1.p1 TRINITY_DN6681_c0_g1~~TRINITY_DN6681_c0_g1_i1.p1  ORF type:complete len:273 (-),score=143.24 TRINITY_DN6681_c0_g1_i1:28-846(-)